MFYSIFALNMYFDTKQTFTPRSSPIGNGKTKNMLSTITLGLFRWNNIILSTGFSKLMDEGAENSKLKGHLPSLDLMILPRHLLSQTEPV